jgi:uncharacterized repeat protein (TIGR02543 family)
VITDVEFDDRNVLMHFWLIRKDPDQEKEYKGKGSNGDEDGDSTTSYTVTFDLNGGDPPAPSPQTINEGESAVRPSGDSSRTGYTFEDWYTDAAGTTPYDFGTPVTESFTLYAKWTADITSLYFGYGPTTAETIGTREVHPVSAVPGTAATNRRTYSVPAEGRYRIEVWGAKGGDASYYVSDGLQRGGYGGYSVGVVTLDVTDTLYLYVGGPGQTETGSTTWTSGGYNGGGQARTTDRDRTSGTGGGGTDISIAPVGVTITDTDHKYYRVIVAGGGGGTAGQGKINGNANSGAGGTQAAGGAGGSGGTTKKEAGFLEGGYSQQTNVLAGGGGGWYGGGYGYASGDKPRTAAGGGSGWIYTQTGYAGWTNDADKGNWKLADKYMLESTGADAARTIGGGSSMPDPLYDLGLSESPTMTGNARGGFIRVTYLGP